MSVGIKISLNNKLYHRDPQETSLGQKLIKHSILLIDQVGFEAFNFKKLAQTMGSTEASVLPVFRKQAYVVAVPGFMVLGMGKLSY